MSVFSIGLSGLNAARNAFNTASNNISNVNTPGYNRERVLLGERGAGQGVKVEGVQRQFDRYVAQQRNGADSRTAALDAYQGQVKQIDDLLADQDAGLQPLMEQFFASLSALASHPADAAARQGVIGTADTLTAQFRSFDKYLSDMGASVDGQLHSQVDQVNDDARQIARLNKQIALAKARDGQAPNSLLDQRDQLVHELGQHVDVRVTEDDSGAYNLAIGNGQPLVAGKRSFELATMHAHADPSRTAIGYRDAAGNTVELDDATFQGGTLGGLLSFRDEALDPTRNSLGRLAVSFAGAFNAVHEAGLDLDGNPGQAMFEAGAPRVYADTANDGSATGTVAFAAGEADQLTGSDYELRYDAAASGFRITRLATGETSTATLDADNRLHFDGLVVGIDDPGALADGDRFQVQPTRAAAGGLENLIHDTGKIAAAGASGGSGNNENALALEQLQNDHAVGGSASFNQAYASLVDQVGSRTSTVAVNLKASQALGDQLDAVQQSQSGVNVDEETVDLVRFQQYYQANAKVLQAGADILDVILRMN